MKAVEQPSEMLPIPRTHMRGIEFYQQVFGEEIGQPPELILDAGAGDSPFAEQVADSPVHQAKIIRVDRDYAHTPPHNETDAIAADALQLPFEDGSFDRAVSCWMLPHLRRKDGAKAISEMIRVIKPHGELNLFPGWLLKQPRTSLVEKQSFTGKRGLAATLTISKPGEWDRLGGDAKDYITAELARCVTLSDPLYRLNSKALARMIHFAGSNQSAESGVTGPKDLPKLVLRRLQERR